MSTPPPHDRAALARERLAARARRISVLRRRVVAATLATFALAWGVIAFAGPMGIDGSTSTTASTQAAQTTTTDDSSSTTSEDTETTDDSSSSTSQDTAPVT